MEGSDMDLFQFAVEATCWLFGFMLAANLVWGLAVILWAVWLQITGRRYK
jgi:hypothetical protein